MGYVYIIKNSINNKVYIGQTMNTLEHRFKKHLETARSKTKHTDLTDAMNEFGADKFWIESLEEGNFTREELYEKEKYYIKKYNSLYPNGYNLQTGGLCDGCLPITRQRLSEKLKGRKVTWGDKVSNTMKEKWENEEYRETMSKAHSHPYKYGHYKKHSKPLRLKLPDEEIISLYQSGVSIYKISKKYNVAFSTIKRRLQIGGVL